MQHDCCLSPSVCLHSLACLLLFLLCNFRCAQLLLLLPVLCEACLVIGLKLLRQDHPLSGVTTESALSLKHGACHEALNLGSFLLLASLATHDELLDIILLLEIEQLPDI